MSARFLAIIGAVGALAVQPNYGLNGPQGKPAAGPSGSSKPASTEAQPSEADAETESAPGLPEPDSTVEAGQLPAVTPVTLSMIPRNPRLVTRLQEMLPDGITVQQAAVGFRSQGQFVAAVYVAKNLDISFLELKQKVVRDRMSLGQAIHLLSPDADVALELARARELPNGSNRRY
jgi:hypothetical protein